MFGVRLIFILALVGGLIAFLADKLGGKIGKKKLTVFGLRPRDTATLLTALAGVLIAVCTVGVLAVSSESARTALFGMEKLQESIKSLEMDKQKAQADLQQALQDAKTKTEKVAELDAKIAGSERAQRAAEASLQEAQQQYAAAQQDLVSARGEVSTLQEAREKLSGEVETLTKTTEELQKRSEALQQGLANVRSGEMLFRSGEVLFAGVVKGGSSQQESLQQVDWLLAQANQGVLQRMQYQPEQGKPLPDALLVSRQDHDKLVEMVATSSPKVEILVRVRALANSVLGEPVLGGFELAQNEKVYKDGEVIHSAVVDMQVGVSADRVFMGFLSEVNRNSVQRGVLPDPVTGRVGSMNAGAMMETVQRMASLGGKVRLTAKARGDIYTSGPVLLDVKVARERVPEAPE